jgi:hypothetical protein
MQPKMYASYLTYQSRNNALPYLDVPSSLPKTVKTKLVGDFSGVHGIGQVLLVGKDKEEGVTKLVLVEHSLQLLTRFRNTFPVVRVYNKNDALGVLVVYCWVH